MRTGTRTIAVCAIACLYANPGAAQRTLTLSEALARAREQAPQIVSARLVMEEVRGRLLGASLQFQENPEIDGALGNRSGPERRFTDFELGFGQTLEPGARRSARIAGANAAIAESAANVDEVTRTALRQAASAFYRALHANERIRLLNASHELAANVYATADRRFKAGDIAVLDVNIARAPVRLVVRVAFDAYSRRLAAVRLLETDAIPGLDENERLTTRSFEVGQLGLPELLLLRREILDTRAQYLDALLEAALARTELDASAAILR
jgi:outer membrane protein TolC